MDKNEIARKLAGYGRREARAMKSLAKVQTERCQFLSGLACDAGLEPEVEAQSVAPKDRG